VRRIAGCTLVAIVALPVLRDPADLRDDSFPLSTYPMFARARGSQIEMAYAIGVTAAGQRRVLTPRLVGSREVLQAATAIDRAIMTGHTRELCREIASRVATDASVDDITQIRIVHGRHDAMAVVQTGEVGREVDYLRCPVRR